MVLVVEFKPGTYDSVVFVTRFTTKEYKFALSAKISATFADTVSINIGSLIKCKGCVVIP